VTVTDSNGVSSSVDTTIIVTDAGAPADDGAGADWPGLLDGWPLRPEGLVALRRRAAEQDGDDGAVWQRQDRDEERPVAPQEEERSRPVPAIFEEKREDDAARWNDAVFVGAAAEQEGWAASLGWEDVTAALTDMVDQVFAALS
jgi:hypothetical protein